MATLTSQPSLSLGPPPAPRAGLGTMVDSLIGSEILKIAGEVRAIERAGRPVCNLTVGDFSPSEFRIPEGLERRLSWETELWDDYLVCPYTRRRAGEMQMVCIESGKGVVARRRR